MKAPRRVLHRPKGGWGKGQPIWQEAVETAVAVFVLAGLAISSNLFFAAGSELALWWFS